MLKNLRRKAPEKDKLGSDLFKFFKLCEHGFPHKPSAIAYDSKLKLLAIGTQSGYLKLFGDTGVEIVAQESSSTLKCIVQLYFIEEQGRLVSVCDNGETNSLHLWEINTTGEQSILEEVKACVIEGRLKKISVCFLSMARDCLYIGTEGGHIYVLDLSSFELREHVIYQDVVMDSLSDEMSKANGGSVEAIKEHSSNPEKLLIGYKKGTIVLWNLEKNVVEESFVASQDVESISWNYGSVTQFVSAHEYGNLSFWSLPVENVDAALQETTTPFGPFPCKAVRKVEWYDETIIFSGGLPRASYGDKHCVSLYENKCVKIVFDFTSKLVDFLTILDENNNPAVLIVLCEEEVVFIDIQKPDSYPVYLKPYLACIHSSTITCSTHISNCPASLWDFIVQAGKNQSTGCVSEKKWPITGGKCLNTVKQNNDLMLTGHEDGTIKFWNVSGLLFNLIYTISTAKLFHNDDGELPATDGEEEWPPFKKVGNFDPYSDDPRFVIQKLLLCPVTNILLVGGSGGQFIIYELKTDSNHSDTSNLSQWGKIDDISIIQNLEGFEWKGLGPLSLSSSAVNTHFGPIPKKIIQLKPAAPVTSLAMDTSSGLVAVGTCHGFLVFDIIADIVVMAKCTVNPTDLANTGAGIQRKRTLTKSLRDSFRRLKSRRSSRKKPEGGGGATSPLKSYEVAPQSRLVDENRVDEAVLSMVRCLYFGETFLGDGAHHTLTLWAGTNAGYIYVYSITVPEKSQRTQTSIKAEVGKELKLKHHAPVMNIFVIDKNGVPLLSSAESDAGRKAPIDMSGGHSVVISSEEQLKVFSLPGLRQKNKEKITAVDGSRVRKLGIIEVKGKTADQSEEITHHCLLCSTNQGDITVYSVPQLKQQIRVKAMKKEDISAISSLLLTHYGEGFFLKSPSELQRITLVESTTHKSGTLIKIAVGARPNEHKKEKKESLISPKSTGSRKSR
ncbi:lethal(2) giant larvae protein homolog 1 isoform X1 [Hydra vulgaris]|uniref:lethal(2) giant larvae protein homolog 1 isoform X1 n=1 Tax=Hydra vulgaris TaxID=6087 RepID=UPI0006416C43|nr:lethal(2) giant larvae protein homolog 1 isoform X1 [Hydra vulgaris]